MNAEPGLIADLREAFGYAFMQRALLAGVLVALMSGLLGTFVVQRRLSFLGDGLAHAAFGGMGLGAFVVVTFGFLEAGFLRDPLWVAVPFSLLAALGIAFVRDRTELPATPRSASSSRSRSRWACSSSRASRRTPTWA